jgi:lambda repressor-like predicted transcriptional regulator
MTADLSGMNCHSLKGIIMNTKFVKAALIVATGLLTGTYALADTSRDQVQAELTQAIRSGDMIAPGDRGQKLNELYPNRYPAKQAKSSLSRDQVQAELAQAIRAGDTLAPGDRGQKLNVLYPSRYPTKKVLAGLTRAQVKAELAQAVRAGDMPEFGDHG